MPVIDDARIQDPSAVTRVVLHAGKIHYDLLAEAEKREDLTTALVRVEQYYPVPRAELTEVLGRYPDAEVVWAQDEPLNQGAAPFVQLEMLRGRFDGRPRRPRRVPPGLRLPGGRLGEAAPGRAARPHPARLQR